MARARAAAATPADTLERDAAALQTAVADLVRVYQFRDRDRICCHDISVTQCYALEALVLHGPLRLGELAARLFLDKSTTSRVVGALVRKGYVQQQAETGDRRAVALNATRAGVKLCDRITRDMVAQQGALLRDLDPRVRAAVVDVVRRLASAAESRFCGSGCATGDKCCVSE